MKECSRQKGLGGERGNARVDVRVSEHTEGLARQASSVDRAAIARSWSEDAQELGAYSDVRIVRGRQFELSMRLRFAEAWYERAVEHGETYRFEVVDQSTSEERKISDLDVHRRAAARAQHFVDRADRERAYEADLSRHRGTLAELREAREGKIEALSKDISALSGKLGLVEA